ncbi:MAG: hypothetical protein ACRDA9_05700 [Plesiomonas shigelloides]
MKIVDSAGIIAVITAYLYSVSSAYTYGYFRTLGLDGDLLERTLQQIIYDGFIKSLTNILNLSLAIFICVIIYALIKIITSNVIRKGFSSARKVVKIRKALSFNNNKSTNVEARCEKYIRGSGLILLILFVPIYALAIHQQDGVSNAKHVINNINNNGDTTFRVKDYKEDMIYLYCGVRNCAGYDIKNRQIIYLPHTQMSIKHEYIKNK